MMTSEDEYRVELDPETGFHCTLRLFANVTNIAEVREKIISGKLRCCIVKASLVVDAFQVAVAANKAALNAQQNCLITRNVYTEILYCLSMSKNISRSLKEFGVGDGDKNILVILLHKPDEEQTILAEVLDCVKGDGLPISRLSEFTDVDLIKKIYKIDENELSVSSLVNAIVSKISCKEFTLAR